MLLFNLRRCSKAAENGCADACWKLAANIYSNRPYAREVGHLEEPAGEPVGAHVSMWGSPQAGIMEGHDVPQDVLTDVVHWLRQWDATGPPYVAEQTNFGHPFNILAAFRRTALEAGAYTRPLFSST